MHVSVGVCVWACVCGRVCVCVCMCVLWEALLAVHAFKVLVHHDSLSSTNMFDDLHIALPQGQEQHNDRPQDKQTTEDKDHDGLCVQGRRVDVGFQVSK